MGLPMVVLICWIYVLDGGMRDGFAHGCVCLFFLIDSRELVDLSSFGLRGARVVLSRCTTDEAIWDWRTPWNVLLLGCASPDR